MVKTAELLIINVIRKFLNMIFYKSKKLEITQQFSIGVFFTGYIYIQ